MGVALRVPCAQWFASDTEQSPPVLQIQTFALRADESGR